MLEKLTSDVGSLKQALDDERETRQSLERALREERERRQAADEQPDEASEPPSEPPSPTPPLHLPVGPPHSQDTEGMADNPLSTSSLPEPTTPPPITRQLYSEAAAPKIRWFNGADDVLSNLHDCPLYTQGHWFSGSESLFQWRKARIMRDFQSAKRILQAQSAYTSMKIGVAINPDKKWYDQMIRIMQDCQIVKAQQYAPFRDELINTGTMSLRENTDHPIWGGRKQLHCNALGSILEQLREDIKNGKISPIQSMVKVTDANAQPPPPNPAYSVNRAPPSLPELRQAPQTYRAGPQQGRLATPLEEEQSGFQLPRYNRRRGPPRNLTQMAPQHFPGSRRVNMRPCYRCGGYGHQQSECTYYQNEHIELEEVPWGSNEGRATAPGSCYACGSYEHKYHECPYVTSAESELYTGRRGRGAGPCYRCGELGHHQKECGFYGPIKCSRCSGYGHKEARCPTAHSVQANFYPSNYH